MKISLEPSGGVSAQVVSVIKRLKDPKIRSRLGGGLYVQVSQTPPGLYRGTSVDLGSEPKRDYSPPKTELGHLG